MNIEQVKPAKPSFSAIVAMFAVAILAIFVGAAIYLTVRSREHKHPPYTSHPTSELARSPLGSEQG